MKAAALVTLAAAAQAGAAPAVHLVGPSSARALLNGALGDLLRCGDSASRLSPAASEQCDLIAFDAPHLHGVFRQRRVLLERDGDDDDGAPAAVTLSTADSAADVAAEVAARGAGAVAVVPTGWEAAVKATAPDARVWSFVDAVAADGGVAASSSSKDALRVRLQQALREGREEAAHGRRLAGGKAAKAVAAAAAAEVEPPVKSAQRPAAPAVEVPWASWLTVAPRTQLLVLVLFALAAIALQRVTCWVLDGAEAALKAATDARTEAEAAEAKAAAAAATAASGGSSAASAASASSESAGGAAAEAAAPLQGGVAVITSGGAALAPSAAPPLSPGGLARVRANVRSAWMRTAAITAAALLFLTLVNVVFDRWRLFPQLAKNKEVGTDVFWAFMAAAALLASYLGVVVSDKDGDVLMGVRQTEEAKGWMMMCFLVYHWWDVKSTYNLIRVLVSAYVFLTGYGNTVSLGSKPPTLAKYAASFLRINFLVTFVSVAMGQPWMLYYICGLHTFWTAYVYVLHATTGGGAGGVSRVPKVWRYVLAIGVNTLLWHVPTLFYAAFSPLTPLLTYEGSLYEWYFRSKLDCYICLVGCLLAEARGPVMAHLRATDTYAMVGLRLAVGAAVLGLHASSLLAIADRRVYNVWHPYTSFVPILGYVFVRNAGSGLRKAHSGVFALMGRHSLEIYLMQFHVWLGALAKTNIALVPSLRAVSAVGQTVIFLFLAGVAFRACNAALALLTRKPKTAITSMAVSGVILMLAPLVFPM